MLTQDELKAIAEREDSNLTIMCSLLNDMTSNRDERNGAFLRAVNSLEEDILALLQHEKELRAERDKYYVQAEVAKEQSSAWHAETEKLKGKLEIAVARLQDIARFDPPPDEECPEILGGQAWAAKQALSKILPPTA